MSISTIKGSGTNQTTLLGSQGIDTYTANDSNLFIDFLNGDDIVYASSAVNNLTVNTGADHDTINFTAEVLNSTLDLSSGDDSAYIEDFSGSIFGGAGDDTIQSSELRMLESSKVRGEGGREYFAFTNISNSLINTNSDDDYIKIMGTMRNSQIYGGRQNDSIIVEDSTNDSLIRGDANRDEIIINGDLINTIINGNAGADELTIRSSNIQTSTVYGGQGADNITISGDAVYANGGKDNDPVYPNIEQAHYSWWCRSRYN